MSTSTTISRPRKCDLCSSDTEAKYDGKTIFGAWGYMCQSHFEQYGVGLGTGRGQELIVEEEE